MRTLLVVVAILTAQHLLAQGTQPTQPNEVSAAQERPQAQPAPKLGHPLDPADVDVLTGKTKAEAAPAYRYQAAPYPSASYPVNAAGYVRLRLLGNNSLASPPLAPLLFGRVNARSFFLFGNTTNFAPPLFFFRRGRTASSRFFFAPPQRSFFFFRH